MTLMQRRRALMAAQGGGNIPQLIPDQSHTFTRDGITLSIADGHHITIDFTTANRAGFVNASAMDKNGTSLSSGGSGVAYNLPIDLLQIPGGGTVSLTISNCTKTPSEAFSDQTGGRIAIGLAQKSSENDVIGNVGLYDNEIRQSNTVTVQSAVDVSCVFLYLSKNVANLSIEFDIGLAINGQKVI